LWIGCMQFVLDKGQEDDWFGSSAIRWAFVFMCLGLVAFLVREFTHDKPLVNLRILANRNLAVGCCLVFVLGGGIYSITSILPNFYQTLMGYSATAAGFAVSPRGLGSIVSSITVGALASKLDPRKIVAFGFALFAFAAVWTGSLTLQISPTSLLWPIVLSGAAMSTIFVPLSSVSLGTLSQKEVGNASGIFNLIRNVGGSVGISAANTLTLRHLQTHRNENVHWLSNANWILQKQLNALTMQMHLHAGPRRAMLRAYSLTQAGLNSQASLWAYVDIFRYLALILALCVPGAFLFKKASSKEGSA
jgi:MFS transporter, DHA2 family, multidrug resistance protein